MSRRNRNDHVDSSPPPPMVTRRSNQHRGMSPPTYESHITNSQRGHPRWQQPPQEQGVAKQSIGRNISGELRSSDEIFSEDSMSDGSTVSIEEGECEDDLDHLVEKPLTPARHSSDVSRLSYEFEDTSIEITPDRLYPQIHPSPSTVSPKYRGVSARTRVGNRQRSQNSSARRLHNNGEFLDDLSSSFNQKPAIIRQFDNPDGPGFGHFLRNTTSSSWDSGGRTKQWFLILLLPLAALVVYKGANLMMDPKFIMNGRPGPDKIMVQLDEVFKSLKVMFPSQPPRIWKTLKAGVRPLLLDTAAGDMPKHPAIILLVANQTSRTVTCLSRSLGKKLSELDLWSNPDCPEINLNIWRDSLPGAVKLRMDEQTQQSYKNGARCLMLTQLEGVPAEGAKMLHALCDGENAQYRDLVLLMSLVLDNDNPLPSFSDHNLRQPDFWRDLEGLVELRLRQLWEAELGVEEMAAIVSRVANNIVPLTEESLATLEKVCLL